MGHNFISVTSSSASSSACTRSCLGIILMRYASGVRPDSPSYSSREIGSSGNARTSKAQSNLEIASHNSRSATWIPGQMRRLRRRLKMSERKGREQEYCISEEVQCSRQARRNTFSHVPSAKRPVVPVHRIGQLARFGARQLVAQEAFRVESESIVEWRTALSTSPLFETRSCCLRVWILLFVVMNFVAIENNSRVLRNVHPIVYKVFCRIVRRRQPKWRMCTLHLRK